MIVLLHQDARPDSLLHLMHRQCFDGWVFLGRDYKRMRLWEKHLENICRRISIGERLEETAWRLRTTYVAWTERTGRPYGDSLVWWTSLVADKNTLVSPLFLYLCFLEIVATLTADPAKQHLLIIVEDANLMETLRLGLRKQGRFVVFAPGTASVRLYHAFWWSIRFIGAWLCFVMERLRAHRAAGASCKAGKGSSPAGHKPVALIHTCVDEACFGSKGQFSDRYFPGLEQWLCGQGYEVMVLPFVQQIRRSLPSAYRWFRRSRTRFFIPEDHIKVVDYLYAVWMVLRQWRMPVGRQTFGSWDITPLIAGLRREQIRNRTNARFMALVPMLRRLARTSWDLRLWIDMYENMPKEKPQIKALRHFFPTTFIVGYQHAALSPFMLKYTMTPEEFRRGPFPDRVVANGPWFRGRLVADGVPERHLCAGPSLRSSFLFGETQSKSQPSGQSDNYGGAYRPMILVPLSLEPGMTLELMEVVIEALADSPYNIAFKIHPMSDRVYLLRQLGQNRLPEHMEWVDGELRDLFSAAACVVSAGSATIMEAASAGVPVVVVGRECGLNMSPLGWWVERYPELAPVFSAAQLRWAVDRAVRISPEEEGRRRALRRELLGCYQPVSDTAMRHFLP